MVIDSTNKQDKYKKDRSKGNHQAKSLMCRAPLPLPISLNYNMFLVEYQTNLCVPSNAYNIDVYRSIVC